MNSIPFVSSIAEPGGFICPLLLCGGFFGDGETNCKCSERKRKKERGEMDLECERGREGGRLCVWAMEGKDKRLFFDGVSC